MSRRRRDVLVADSSLCSWQCSARDAAIDRRRWLDCPTRFERATNRIRQAKTAGKEASRKGFADAPRLSAQTETEKGTAVLSLARIVDQADILCIPVRSAWQLSHVAISGHRCHVDLFESALHRVLLGLDNVFDAVEEQLRIQRYTDRSLLSVSIQWNSASLDIYRAATTLRTVRTGSEPWQRLLLWDASSTGTMQGQRRRPASTRKTRSRWMGSRSKRSG